jgi:GT2 family glycosyltransferase
MEHHRLKPLKIAVAIVSYNSTAYTLALLRSIEKLTLHGHQLSIIIVDNGTEEAAYKKLVKFVNQKRLFPIKLIRNKKNVGLSKALNQTLRFIKKSDYVWRLDNDVILPKTVLQDLLKTMDTFPDCGCVGSIAFDYDSHKPIFGGGWKVNWWRGSVIPIQPIKVTTECDFVSGYSLLFPTKVIQKIGYLSDENYFAYVEDVDICRQVQKQRKKVYLNPKAIVYHPTIMAKHLNPFLMHLSTRNRIFMIRKNALVWQKLTFMGYFLSVSMAFNLRNIWKLKATAEQKMSLLQAYLKGVGDGFFMKMKSPVGE